MIPPTKTSKIAIFSTKVTVKVTNHGVIPKGIMSGVHMPNMKSLSLAVKIIANVKVDDRQKLRLTDRTKQYALNLAM